MEFHHKSWPSPRGPLFFEQIFACRKLHGSHAPCVRSYISPRMAKWLVEAAGAPKIQKGTKKETLGEDLAARFFS